MVDDGSVDRTREIAAAEGARVVRHLQNLGYGRSLKDGIADARYGAIAIIDADGTYPVKDIPRLFRNLPDRLSTHGGPEAAPANIISQIGLQIATALDFAAFGRIHRVAKDLG